MSPRALHLGIVAFGLLASAACESGPIAPTWVPGPGVPAVPTAQPLTWDSREELSAWVVNPVSRGPISVQEEGPTAFIRVITGGDVLVILRGPDFSPPTRLAGVRFRYRWIVSFPPGVGGTGAAGDVGTAQPVNPPWPPGLLRGRLDGTARSDWREAYFEHFDRTSDEIQYVYFRFEFGSDYPGQLDFDWIRIER